MATYHHLTPRAHAELETRLSLLTETRFRAEAQALLEEGRVERTGPDTWEVIGRSSGRIYKMRQRQCPCTTKRDPSQPYSCAHLLAVALYGWVEETMAKEGSAMFVTNEEPTSHDVHDTLQESPQDTNGSQDDPGVVLESQGLLEASGGSQDDVQTEVQRMQRYVHFLEAEIMKRDDWLDRANARLCSMEEQYARTRSETPSVPQALVSDLTPVPVPGGGERTRTIGQLMGAFARAQQRMKNPAFDKQGQVGNLKTRFASTPAMRNEIIAALAAEAIGLLQYVYHTEQGLRCMTTLGHPSGEYISVPLDVPLSGTSLTERGKTVGFVKRWALQTTVVLFGEDEAEGMEPLPPLVEEKRQAPRQGTERHAVPDMTQTSAPRQGRKSADELRHEIETLATQQQRLLEHLWGAAKTRFGRSREELTVEDLEKMLRWLQEKGAA